MSLDSKLSTKLERNWKKEKKKREKNKHKEGDIPGKRPKSLNPQILGSSREKKNHCCGLCPAGHFQFLDSVSPLQRAICEPGNASDDDVRGLSQAVMVAWGEAMVQHAGETVFTTQHVSQEMELLVHTHAL